MGHIDLLLYAHSGAADLQHRLLHQGVFFHLPTTLGYAVYFGQFVTNYEDSVSLSKKISCSSALTNYSHLLLSFYAFSAYLVGVFGVWVREMIVYILAHVREHFFIIDFWSGICIFALAIAGFILLLGKNMHVKTWWSINV